MQTNKALKLDPKDAEVVATKMRTIAQETTLLSQKMEHLKHIREEMAKKDTSAMNVEELEKYKAGLSRVETEIAKTTTALKTLKAEQRQSYTSQIEEAKKLANAEQKRVEEAIAMEKKRVAEIEATRIKSLEAVEAFRKAEDEADKKRQAEKLAREEQLKNARLAAEAEISTAMTTASQNLNRGMSMIGSTISSIMRTISMIELAIVRLGTSAVKTGMAFDEQMSQVAATLDIDQVVNQESAAFARLRNEAIELGRTTTYTASEAAEALNTLALGGLGVEKSLAALPQVLTLAKAGSMDLEKAANMVVASMSALNLNVTDVDTLMDQMARTAQKSKVTVEQVGDSILKTASAFNLAGQDTATMNAILGTLGNRFDNITDQANTLRTALNRISTFSGDLEELGVQVEDEKGNIRNFIDIFSDLREALEYKSDTERVSILTKIFGSRGYSYAAYLMQATTGELQNLRREIENSDGAAEQMAKTMTDNLQSDMTIVKSAAESLAIAITDKLTPSLRDAANDATTGLNNITDIVENGELGEEFEKLGKSLNDLVSKSLQALIKYGPKIVEYLTWTVDNLGTIVKLFAGLKVASWVKNIGTGLGLVTQSVITMRTELVKAKADGMSLGETLKLDGVATSLASVATAATSAAIAIGTIIAAALDAKAAAMDVTGEIWNDKAASEYLETVKDFSREMGDARKERQADIDLTEEQRKEYKAMADRITELANAEELDAAGKNEMLSLIYQLNTAIPNLNLQYDESTNSLNMQNKELAQLIDNYEDLQRLTALEAYGNELATQKIKYEFEESTVQADVDKALKAKNDAKFELYKLIRDYDEEALPFGSFDEISDEMLEAAYQSIKKKANFWGVFADIDEVNSWEGTYNSFKTADESYIRIKEQLTNIHLQQKTINEDLKKTNEERAKLANTVDTETESNTKLSEEMQRQHDLAVEYLEAEGDQSDALERLLEQHPELIEVLLNEGYTYDQLTKSTKDDTDAQQTLTEKLETLKKATSGYKSELKDLLGVLENVNKGTAYSTSQMLDLIEKYPELINYIHQAADGYTIEADAVQRLTEVKAENTLRSLQMQISALEGQMSSAAHSGDRETFETLRQQYALLQEQKSAYGEILADIQSGRIYSGSTSSGSSGGSSYSSANNEDDPYSEMLKERKAQAKSEENELENLYKREQITAEEYYNGLMDIARRYYDGIGDLRDEYLNAEEKVYTGLKKAQEDELSNAKKLTDQLKAVKDAEDALRNAQSQQVQVYSGAAGFRVEQNTAAIEKAQSTLADKNYSLAETLLKNAKFDGRTLTERLQSIGLAQIRDMLPDLSGITLPSIGGGVTQTTTSTRNLTYTGGDINININGSVDESVMPTLKTSIEDAVRKGIEAFLDEENAAAVTGVI